MRSLRRPASFLPTPEFPTRETPPDPHPPAGAWHGAALPEGDCMPTKDTGSGNGGRRPTGNTGRNRNAYCSFCRKSYRDVGPLVEGPGDVYICGECIELCQSIIDQEKRRRNVTKNVVTNIPSPRSIKEKLD